MPLHARTHGLALSDRAPHARKRCLKTTQERIVHAAHGYHTLDAHGGKMSRTAGRGPTRIASNALGNNGSSLPPKSLSQQVMEEEMKWQQDGPQEADLQSVGGEHFDQEFLLAKDQLATPQRPAGEAWAGPAARRWSTNGQRRQGRLCAGDRRRLQGHRRRTRMAPSSLTARRPTVS